MGITRQLAALDDLLRRAEEVPEVEAVILIGSLASGAADAVSDVDAIVIVGEFPFNAAFKQRHALHASSVPACWDHPIDPSPSDVEAHKWIDDSGVLVEVLIAAASGPLRVAEPARVVLGDPAVLTRTNRRPPIRREEMSRSTHPVESAYDKLKDAVRHASVQPPTARPPTV
jgi:predicted nucleotidyltransferase